MKQELIAESSFLLFRGKAWRRRRHAGPAEVVLLDASAERREAFERAARRIGIHLRTAASLPQLRELVDALAPDLAVSVHQQTHAPDGQLSAELTRVGQVLEAAPWRMNWAAFTEESIHGVVALEGPPSGIEKLLVGMDESLSPN